MHPPPLLLAEKKRSAVHGVGEEEALVQTKAVPCFYKMLPCKVAVPVLFGADLTCFSVPIRLLAGRVLVAVRCWWCKLACPLHLFPLPLAWCAPHPRLPRRSPAGGAKVIVNSEEVPPPGGGSSGKGFLGFHSAGGYVTVVLQKAKSR